MYQIFKYVTRLAPWRKDLGMMRSGSNLSFWASSFSNLMSVPSRPCLVGNMCGFTPKIPIFSFLRLYDAYDISHMKFCMKGSRIPTMGQRNCFWSPSNFAAMRNGIFAVFGAISSVTPSPMLNPRAILLCRITIQPKRMMADSLCLPERIHGRLACSIWLKVCHAQICRKLNYV